MRWTVTLWRKSSRGRGPQLRSRRNRATPIRAVHARPRDPDQPIREDRPLALPVSTPPAADPDAQPDLCMASCRFVRSRRRNSLPVRLSRTVR